MNLYDILNKIENKGDLVNFIGVLINDLQVNPNEWENISLQNYLEAMQSWIEDMDGWEINSKIDTSKMTSWQLIGHILLASKIYE